MRSLERYVAFGEGALQGVEEGLGLRVIGAAEQPGHGVLELVVQLVTTVIDAEEETFCHRLWVDDGRRLRGRGRCLGAEDHGGQQKEAGEGPHRKGDNSLRGRVNHRCD